MYAERYPDIPSERWAVIENGFDEENFREAESALLDEPLGVPGQITLIHSGVLYPLERDPRPFFAALRKMKDAGEISPDKLKIILRATGSDDLYRPMLAESGIADIVHLAATVGYRDALGEMLRADGLLLFQASICNEQVPAKLYEYLRAGRPILALTDPVGNTAEALRAAGMNDIVRITDEDDIVMGMRRFLAAIREGRQSGATLETARKHSRQARTAELAKLLDGIVLSGQR
jgi:glycosyltransferase involved in cell wall biosynthesis